MDFDKTSFSVDWYTPGDKCTPPARLSFPKSARISLDDLLPDTPLSFCFSPIDGPRTYPFVDTPCEAARGWTSSAPPSPLAPSDPMCDQRPKGCDESDWRTLASPGILSVADDCALCGVDLDVSCLDALDEQLLLSPMDCFSELCWTAAVRDEMTAPLETRKTSRSRRARSHERDSESTSPPGNLERPRPLAARIAVPLEVFPHFISSPSPLRESHDASLMYKEKSLACFPDVDPEGRFLALPIQGSPYEPLRSKKRDLAQRQNRILTRSLEPLAPSQPPTPTARLQSSKSSQTLRVISDAYSSITRARRRSPLLA